jgi:hypothetical protein
VPDFDAADIDALVSASRRRHMGVLFDLRAFVRQHRSCGVLGIHLNPPGEFTYDIEITCRRCATGLSRTVDATSAAWDLMHTDLATTAN